MIPEAVNAPNTFAQSALPRSNARMGSGWYDGQISLLACLRCGSFSFPSTKILQQVGDEGEG